MQKSDILSYICKNGNISYILFSNQFEIVDFSHNVLSLADNVDKLKKGTLLQDAFYEYIGLEESIQNLLLSNQTSIKIPMVQKKSNYYDIEITLYDSSNNNPLFMILLIQKSSSELKYIKTLQEINKKTFFLQNADSKGIKKNYYNLINKQLVTFNVNLEGVITEVNEMCSYFLGIESQNLIGLHFSNFFHTRLETLNDESDKILNAKNSSGEEIFFHADVISLKQNDKVYEKIIICQDITYLKRIEKELEYVAAHDSLTGLANRSQLLRKIDDAILQNKESGKIFGICFIDLDKFKPINDTYGHHAGDMLLKHVASILVNFVRDFDTVARIGGDEFIILFRDIENEEYLLTAIQRIIELPKNNPLLYSEEETISFMFSLGLSIYPTDANNAKDLLDLADKNMYMSKKEKHK